MMAGARLRVTAALVLAGSMLAACSTQSPSGAGASAAARTQTVPARETAASAEPARATVAESEPSNVSVIDEILAARRRGDYPELELLETGFTITEQVRIGSEARSDYERAISLLRSERHREGIAVLREITESTPDATVPYIDLGIAYADVGDFELAEEALKTAELLSPEHPIVKNELGILYRKTGRFAEARASYEQALAIFQDFHFARRNLAVLCDLYLADLDCALSNYRSYLESVGSDSEVEIWVADLENRLGY